MSICLWFHSLFPAVDLAQCCPPKCRRTPIMSAGGVIGSIILIKWLNVHNKICNFYEPWAGVSWHVLVVKFQCVLVRMFPACVYSWSHHTSWDCLCGFAQLLTQVSEDMGESGGRLQDSGLKKRLQWLRTSETLKLAHLSLSLEGSRIPTSHEYVGLEGCWHKCTVRTRSPWQKGENMDFLSEKPGFKFQSSKDRASSQLWDFG